MNTKRNPKKNGRRRKILSVLLALCLLLSPAPAAVLAYGLPPLDGTETVLDLDRLTGDSVGGLWEPGGAWYYDASTKELMIYGGDDQGRFTLTGGGLGSGVS